MTGEPLIEPSNRLKGRSAEGTQIDGVRAAGLTSNPVAGIACAKRRAHCSGDDSLPITVANRDLHTSDHTYGAIGEKLDHRADVVLWGKRLSVNSDDYVPVACIDGKVEPGRCASAWILHHDNVE